MAVVAIPSQSRRLPNEASIFQLMPQYCLTCESALASVVGAAYLRLHRRYRAGGLRVAISTRAINVTSALDRLEKALEFIAEVDPIARKRIATYVDHIVVWPGPYSAANRWGGVHLSAEYLMIARQPRLAGTLVHEATHLRIKSRGIPYRSSLRERIERACIREEAHFLRRIPDTGEDFAREVEAELESEWWSNDSHNRTVKDAVARGDLPQWAARLVRRR